MEDVCRRFECCEDLGCAIDAIRCPRSGSHGSCRIRLRVGFGPEADLETSYVYPPHVESNGGVWFHRVHSIKLSKDPTSPGYPFRFICQRNVSL